MSKSKIYGPSILLQLRELPFMEAEQLYTSILLEKASGQLLASKKTQKRWEKMIIQRRLTRDLPSRDEKRIVLA